MNKLKPCPFCGGEAIIQIRDEEGNLHSDDYLEDAYSGLSFTIAHYHEDNPDCPIATYKDDDGHLGVYLYYTEEEAIESWNERKQVE